MRTIATRLLPNPHCLSSHAVHRIRHRPAVHSSRWLRVCPRRTSVRPGAPSDRCGATTTTKDGRPPPRSPLPSPPRYNPEMRRPPQLLPHRRDGFARAARPRRHRPGARTDHSPPSPRIGLTSGTRRRRIASRRSIMCLSRTHAPQREPVEILLGRTGRANSPRAEGGVFQQLLPPHRWRFEAVACSGASFPVERAFYQGFRGATKAARSCRAWRRRGRLRSLDRPSRKAANTPPRRSRAAESHLRTCSAMGIAEPTQG